MTLLPSEILDAHVKALELSLYILKHRISKARKAEAIALLERSLSASQRLIESHRGKITAVPKVDRLQ